MAWTQERINMLIDLWMSGKSASSVAKALGNVSRNAVIGKVHRLGISNRDTVKKVTQGAAKSAAKATNTQAKTTKNHKQPKKISISSSKETGGNVRLRSASSKIPHPPRQYTKQTILAHDPNVTTSSKKLSLFDLRENTCRWPSGDPREKDFHFCGCPTQDGSPYCAYHTKIAYSNSSKSDGRQYIALEPKNPSLTEEFNDNVAAIDGIKISEDAPNNAHYM